MNFHVGVKVKTINGKRARTKKSIKKNMNFKSLISF